jgi:hypothetical protein
MSKHMQNDDEITSATERAESCAATRAETASLAKATAAEDDAAQADVATADADSAKAVVAYGADPSASNAKTMHATAQRSTEARARALHTSKRRRDASDNAAGAARAHDAATQKLANASARRAVATLRADIADDVGALAHAMLEVKRLAEKIDARAGVADDAVRALANAGEPLEPKSPASPLGAHVVLAGLLRELGGDELVAANAPKSSGNGIARYWLAEDYRPGEVATLCVPPALRLPAPSARTTSGADVEDRLATLDASLAFHHMRAFTAATAKPEAPKTSGNPPGSKYAIDEGRLRFGSNPDGRGARRMG